MAAGYAAALPGRDGGRGGHTLPCRVHSRAWQLCLMALILHTVKMTVLIVLYHFFKTSYFSADVVWVTL